MSANLSSTPLARRGVRIAVAVTALMTLFTSWTVASGEDGRAATPEDRYALAGGCYRVLSTTSGHTIVREGGGFALAESGNAEPFFFQATDLGSYLLYGSAEDFLAASESPLGEATDDVKGSTPGGIASGLTVGASDTALDAVGKGPAATATGRGAEVVAAGEPSELADWEIDEVAPGAFSIALPAVDKVLVESGDALGLAPADADPGLFTFELTEGCATYPDVEINIDGEPLAGETSFAETRGFLEAHLHMMAYEFIGGASRCGAPWHRYGVAYALVDCPDHEPNGEGAVLEQVLSGFGPHDTDGWPTFAGWPRPESLTHEQVYYRWLERAWRGGLRMMVNLLVDNRALCRVYPYKEHGCNEMDGVRLQAQRINELQDYIDAQSGGPGEGWFRIVTDPFEARRVINEGKLVVVLGIEVSIPLDCGVVLDEPQCDTEQIDAGLDEVYALGVRQMELVNKFDNALSGVTGDANETGIVVNSGNVQETGKFWQFDTCPDGQPFGEDKHQHNFHDQSGAPDEFSGRDSIFGGVLAATGTSGAAPVYPEGPHCNVRGLTDLGEHMIRGMMDRGMIFDPDHMSARARHQALDLLEDEGYSGVVSSHSWADDTIYPRVHELGGVVTPHAGRASSFVGKWQKQKGWANPNTLFGIGFGSDMNGFSTQGHALQDEDPPASITYPFTGFGGVTVEKQVSGTRTYDINSDGVSHYGLYPDWVEAVRVLAGDEGDEFMADLERGPEAYLQMWERAIGIAPNACRADVDDLTDDDIAGLSAGMTTVEVMQALGQPDTRTASAFTFCLSGARTATATFSTDGLLTGWTTA